MDAPCCVGVIRDSAGLVGKEVTIGEKQTAYYSSPKVKSGKRMGIVVVHDIFGFALPNSKYICDHLAKKGFDAVMPDFFSGKGLEPECWPATETEITRPMGDDFKSWFGSICTDKFWEGFKSEVDDATAFLKRKGCIRYGIIGFCWGGRAAEVAAGSGRFGATVTAHGCMHSADTYKEVKGDILYLTVPDDDFFSKSAQDAITAAGGKVKVFDGMGHGFAVRGDFTDSKVKAAADEVMADSVALFEKACLRKPKFIKVTSIDPNSTGVNCLVKVTQDIKEVEETKKSGGVVKFHEVTVGDESGQVTLSLKDFQSDGLKKDMVLYVRNAHARMVNGHIRVVVDKWGKLDRDVKGADVSEVGSKNISDVEYELAG